MVRKQIILDERHERFLKAVAAETDASEGELVRRGLELLMDGSDEPRMRSSEERERRVEDLRDALDAFAHRSSSRATGDRWSRDDAYAERLGRWSE